MMAAGHPAAHVLCRIEDIPDGEGRGFTLGEGAARLLVFVLRRGARLYGYRNECPHLGTPLDWIPDQFLTRDKAQILCATHGARFRIEDGACIAGPCQGDRLAALPVELRGGLVVLQLPVAPASGTAVSAFGRT